MKIEASFSHVKVAKYSPNGFFIALIVNSELMVYCSKAIEVVVKRECNDVIEDVSWSRDSDHLFYIMKECNSLEAFSLSRPNWRCRITAGKEGLASAVWCPSGFNILTISDFGVRIRGWSLRADSVFCFENPRITNDITQSFSCCGNYFILQSTKDTEIRIYRTRTWKLHRQISTDGENFGGPVWSPQRNIFAMYNSYDMESISVTLYSTESGECIRKLKKTGNRQISGIKMLLWDSRGQFLATASFDSSIYLLDYCNLSIFATLTHRANLSQETCDVFLMKANSFVRINERPITFTQIERGREPSHFPGIKTMCFDQNSQLLVSIDGSMPAVTWIWDMRKFLLKNVIVFKTAVTDIQWYSASELVLCDESFGITLWRSHGASYLNLSTLACQDTIATTSCRPHTHHLKSQILLLSKSHVHVINM